MSDSPSGAQAEWGWDGVDRRQPTPTADEDWNGEGSPIEIGSKEKETIRILVVDDERTLRESCSSILGAEGFSVTGKGDEALQLLKRIRPQIVLVDLYMPDISGMDILDAAVKQDPECLVVVMTGRASVESSIHA